MGQEQIAIAAMGVIIPDVLRELLPAVEESRAFRPGHQHGVEIIGRATDHANWHGPDFHRLAALDEIAAGARDHERLPAGRTGIGHDLAVLRLPADRRAVRLLNRPERPDRL
jgi:hypothetical protein